MAFLPSMRATTSRVTLPALPALSVTRSRSFRASPIARKGEIGTTIQEADKALADYAEGSDAAKEEWEECGCVSYAYACTRYVFSNQYGPEGETAS